mmetsp:Transcript_2138/g.6537  ORF Transcript_2138/g.6537 Transcript_2138/m.6537 type:complete len:124 (-) Transcript_2138:152-523(-)
MAIRDRQASQSLTPRLTWQCGNRTARVVRRPPVATGTIGSNTNTALLIPRTRRRTLQKSCMPSRRLPSFSVGPRSTLMPTDDLRWLSITVSTVAQAWHEAPAFITEVAVMYEATPSARKRWFA